MEIMKRSKTDGDWPGGLIILCNRNKLEKSISKGEFNFVENIKEIKADITNLVNTIAGSIPTWGFLEEDFFKKAGNLNVQLGMFSHSDNAQKISEAMKTGFTVQTPLLGK